MIRFATAEDRGALEHMLGAMLEDNYHAGGEIEPCPENVAVYLSIVDAYIAGRLEGVVLVAEAPLRYVTATEVVAGIPIPTERTIIGMLLWGQGGANPFRTRWGKTAMGWGTYVSPAHRGFKISTKLRAEGARWLRHMGFEHVVGSAVDTNIAGVESGLRSGGFKRHGIVGVIDLRGSNVLETFMQRPSPGSFVRVDRIGPGLPA